MRYSPSEPQRLARSHLLAHPDTFLLMGMGLGKTATIIDHLDTLLLTGEARAMLVIAPLAVCNLTWPNEVAKFEQFRQMRIADLRTEEGQKQFTKGTAHIYTVNWESLPTVAVLLAKQKSLVVPYDMVVFDESTKAKSNQSKRAAIYREYCPRVARQIAMTGTPAPNSEADLWGQMTMVDGGKRLGPSFSNFQKTYFKPTDFRKYKWVLKDGAGERIYKRISDVTLTLRTSDWLDLPDTVVNDIEVDLGSALMSQYRQFEDELVTQIRDKVITAPNAAALITKLMQFTSGATYDEEKLVHEIHDKKVRALVETVRKIDGPTLIGYAYQHEVDRLRKALPKAEFFSDYKNKAAQVQMLARWNAGKIPQLVAHPASMAHGLNMQDGGCNLVWYSQTYSREKSEQMLGRLFRRGQRNEVNLWRLMCPGTVDYAVALALENKAASENTLLTALQSLEAFRRGGGVVEIGDDSDLMEDDENIHN